MDSLPLDRLACLAGRSWRVAELPGGLTNRNYRVVTEDDPVVPILHAQAAYHQLRAAGDQVIFDRTTGYGHAVWDYAAGNQRASAWAPQQALPLSTTVRQLDFTALDGAATRSWWASPSATRPWWPTAVCR